MTQRISIVCPVYNERDNVLPFVSAVLGALQSEDVDLELLFVADPCSDGTEAVIGALAHGDPRVRLITLTRRFGQAAATLAGLEQAHGDAIIVMDVDLQDPPEILPQMIAAWREGALIVLAQRRTRTGEPWLRMAVAKIGYAFLNKFSDVPIPKDTGDFRLMDRKIINEIARFPESGAFLRGIVALIGYEPAVVYFDRPARRHGRTKYNRWIGNLGIAFNGIVGFSTALLKISTLLGVLAALSAFVLAVGYGIATILGAPFPIGNPSIVVLVLLMGGANLVCLGILGLYVGRTYEEVKRRPRYIVRT
jgi:dolichol-phosphate mannosyltransferase